jgi:hypothetical protein
MVQNVKLQAKIMRARYTLGVYLFNAGIRCPSIPVSDSAGAVLSVFLVYPMKIGAAFDQIIRHGS